MRTALIAAVKRTETHHPGGQPRAEMLLAGRSVLAWQVGLARDLGCERIICLCDAPTDTILTLQRETESSGGEFHAIRSNLQLVSLMRADDELVMMLDGLLPDRDVLVEFVGGPAVVPNGALRKGIATIPAGHRLAENYGEDFERIDRDRCWAGIAVMRAGPVQKLADLPPDGDPMSLLLRLALQERVECRELIVKALDGQNWVLADHAGNLAERERALVAASVPAPVWTGPSTALAGIAVKQIAPRWFDGGPEVSAGLSAFLLMTGVGLAAFGYGAAGLGVAALGALSGAVCRAWSGLRHRLWSKDDGQRFRNVVPLAVDGATLAALILVNGWSGNPIAQLALPVLALGLARLATGDGKNKAGSFWQDRSLHLAGFAIAALTGYLSESLALFAIAALAALTYDARNQLTPRLTGTR